MSTKPLSVAALAAFAGALATAQPTVADEVADFYKERNLTIVVGFSPGGGADAFARFLARHLGDHVPGKPSVIVQNMPGAGGLTSLNHVYNTEPQDGTRTILTSPSHTLSQVLDSPNVRYDMRKMHWLGTLTRDTTSCVASGRPGIRSITETADKELVVGATGPNDTVAQQTRLLASLLGLPADLSVVGFDDIDEGERSQPSLTTVGQDHEEKGRTAAVHVSNILAKLGMASRAEVAAWAAAGGLAG
jgi:tripartite-type tricarboxylate transporter receptor subunit TctC